MRKALLFSLSLTAAWLLLAADLPSAEEFQRQLEGKLVAVQTIQADFIQTRELPALEMTLRFTGKLAFDAKARRLLWRVETPLPCAFRMQNGELAQWDGETGKVVAIPAARLPWIQLLQERLALWLSGDLKALRKEAEVAVASENRVRLTPSGGVLASLAKSIEIDFAEDRTRVTQIRLEEKGGDLLTIHFTNAILNQPIAEETWKL